MSRDFNPILTKAALMLQNDGRDFRVLTFADPKRSIKNHTIAKKEHFNDNGSMESAEQQKFDIKTARRDVIKFAMNNQRDEKLKKKMMIYEMTRMGLKAPKKPYKNYKVLIKERKCLKENREQRRKFYQLGKTQTGLAAVKCKSKLKLEKRQKKRPPISSIDKHYGTVTK